MYLPLVKASIVCIVCVCGCLLQMSRNSSKTPHAPQQAVCLLTKRRGRRRRMAAGYARWRGGPSQPRIIVHRAYTEAGFVLCNKGHVHLFICAWLCKAPDDHNQGCQSCYGHNWTDAPAAYPRNMMHFSNYWWQHQHKIVLKHSLEISTRSTCCMSYKYSTEANLLCMYWQELVLKSLSEPSNSCCCCILLAT